MAQVVSMTGFGRGTASGPQGVWTVELRSVNHRYLDIGLKIPRRFMGWEEKIKKEIGNWHVRGRVDVFVTFSDEGAAGERLKTDLRLAREYLACLEEMAATLALEGKPDLAMLASYRDIIVPVDEEIGTEMLEELWEPFCEALGAALGECSQMRQREGQRLVDDLLERLNSFQATLDTVESSLPGIIANREGALKERLDTLLAGVAIDPLRLAQEVAIVADRLDVTEELVRVASHLEQLRELIAASKPIGRRLDFLVQELLREVNTVASKISNAETAHMTVAMKNDLEKIREQVQNLE